MKKLMLSDSQIMEPLKRAERGLASRGITP